MALQAGEVIAAKYRLDRVLGEGGMGTVWAATHVNSAVVYAVKFLKPDLAMRVEIIHRFIREARAVNAVRHPNVVRVHEISQLEDGTPFMVMDYLRGETLGQKLERETHLSPELTAAILIPAIEAVGAAHALGIVHRDLKPDNLFLAEEGDRAVVKVLDFGIAKLTATEGEAAATGALTKTGSVLGTPFYMSPEQAFGEKDVDHRSDIWTFGIILYECLTGRRPTHADNVGQVFKAITTGTFPPPSSLVPSLPRDLDALAQKMLSRDRAERPQGLDEVREALAKYGTSAGHIPPPKTEVESADLGSAATILSDDKIQVASDIKALSERARTLSAVGVSTPAPSTAPPRPKRSRTALVIGPAALALVAGSLLFVKARDPGPSLRSQSTSASAPLAEAVATEIVPSRVGGASAATLESAPAPKGSSVDLAAPKAGSAGSPSKKLVDAGARALPSAAPPVASGNAAKVAPTGVTAPTNSTRGPGGLVAEPTF